MLFLFAGLAMLGFFLADRLFGRVAALFGSKAQVGDPEGLPVLLFVVSVFALLAQPALNSVTRIGESDADAYSLRTVNLPDALAAALVKTAEYRYPRPSALRGSRLLLAPFGRTPRAPRDGMEGEADEESEAR